MKLSPSNSQEGRIDRYESRTGSQSIDTRRVSDTQTTAVHNVQVVLQQSPAAGTGNNENARTQNSQPNTEAWNRALMSRIEERADGIESEYQSLSWIKKRFVTFDRSVARKQAYAEVMEELRQFLNAHERSSSRHFSTANGFVGMSVQQVARLRRTGLDTFEDLEARAARIDAFFSERQKDHWVQADHLADEVHGRIQALVNAEMTRREQAYVPPKKWFGRTKSWKDVAAQEREKFLSGIMDQLELNPGGGGRKETAKDRIVRMQRALEQIAILENRHAPTFHGQDLGEVASNPGEFHLGRITPANSNETTLKTDALPKPTRTPLPKGLEEVAPAEPNEHFGTKSVELILEGLPELPERRQIAPLLIESTSEVLKGLQLLFALTESDVTEDIATLPDLDVLGSLLAPRNTDSVRGIFAKINDAYKAFQIAMHRKTGVTAQDYTAFRTAIATSGYPALVQDVEQRLAALSGRYPPERVCGEWMSIQRTIEKIQGVVIVPLKADGDPRNGSASGNTATAVLPALQPAITLPTPEEDAKLRAEAEEDQRFQKFVTEYGRFTENDAGQTTQNHATLIRLGTALETSMRYGSTVQTMLEKLRYRLEKKEKKNRNRSASATPKMILAFREMAHAAMRVGYARSVRRTTATPAPVQMTSGTFVTPAQEPLAVEASALDEPKAPADDDASAMLADEEPAAQTMHMGGETVANVRGLRLSAASMDRLMPKMPTVVTDEIAGAAAHANQAFVELETAFSVVRGNANASAEDGARVQRQLSIALARGNDLLVALNRGELSAVDVLGDLEPFDEIRAFVLSRHRKSAPVAAP